MKTLFRTLVCLLILTTQIHAQSTPDFSQKENLDWKTFKSEEQTSATALSRNKAALYLDTNDDLELIDTQDDQLGFRHYRYQQTYKDIPVEGAIYLMHEKNNRVKTANGRLIQQQLNLTTTPTISEATALQAALRFVGASLYAWNDPTHETNLKQAQDCSDASFYPYGELVIIAPGEQKKADDYRLAYKFDIYAVEPLTRQIVYVDAQNETVLTSLEKIHNCTGAPASGATKYSGDVDFSACLIGGAYTLRNSDTDTNIQVFDSGNISAFPQAAVTDTDGFFEEDSASVEVYWATQNAYDYFLNTHDRNSLDGSGMALFSWVHFGDGFNNAFWNGSWMTYGDGDNQRFSALTSPDVVGHEIMHGITDFSADLIYQGESGALNESFSDIFGEVVEAYSRGTNDWIMGADFTVQAGKNGLRNLSNPNDPNMLTTQPDTYFGDNWYGGGNDGGGVHTNSGVQNYWFYLLVEGGNGTNDFGYAYDVEGIGMSKTAAIAYRNLTVYLTPGSQYFDARIGAIQAAVDLYGADSNEALQTEAAWAAVGVSTQITNTCRERDSLALVALYDATNGPNWTETWDLAQPIDTWFGVSLNQGGCVRSLNLPSNQLEGSIPADLGELGSLWSLFLVDNNLSGDIPVELGNLTQLEYLRIQRNQLSGNIPTELGNLIYLKDLDLAQNQLSGTIPVALTNLTNLNLLSLGFNQLSGGVIPELGSMTNLTNLGLGSNQLTGNIPQVLSNLIHLEVLSLGGNQLTGEIPNELSSLVNLKYLGFINNQLEGNFPAWIGNLSHLNSISLSSNQLSGCYPSELSALCNQLTNSNNNANISNGNNFDATWEDFCNTGAGTCGQQNPCRQSDSLALVAFYNEIDGLSWDLNAPINTWNGVTLSPEGCVTRLIWTDGVLAGNIPPEIGNLSYLTVLNLHENGIGGNIPPELGNLTELEFLSLEQNISISGEIPVELSNLTKLKFLSLAQNDLSGSIPPELGNLSNLETLRLGSNQLTGNIPSEFVYLSNLTELTLRENQLSGCYVPELTNLCNQLTSATIDGGNNFDATWEDFCSVGLGSCNIDYTTCREADSIALITLYDATDGGNWINQWNLNQPIDTWHGVTLTSEGCVKELNLSAQNLNGNISHQIHYLDSLTKLDLSNNQIVGEIPGQFGYFTSLKWLDLSGNSLSGSIPYMSASSQPTHISLADNQLSGEFFAYTFRDLTTLVSLSLANNQLTGSIPPDLGGLANLTSLSLANNQLSGGIPLELSNLVNLQELYLQNNQLFGCYNEQLSSLCNQLVSFNISEGNDLDVTWENFCNNNTGNCSTCRQSDSLTMVTFYNNIDGLTWDLNTPIDTWSGLEFSSNGCLTEIILEGLNLSGTIAEEVGDLIYLETLNLKQNQLTGEIPAELGNLEFLSELYLNLNQLSGNIPGTLGNLNNLKYLSLSINQLTGEIPAELGNLESLLGLYIGNNQLMGNIPSELGNLNNLVNIYLDDNELSGNIPPELGNLNNLLLLSLTGNQLTGNIPLELGNMSSVSNMKLNNNQLTGSIPEEFSYLSNLYFLYLSNNELSGCYESSLNNLCGQLIGDNITQGNNFDATWQDFCNTGAGSCEPITASAVWPGDFNNDGIVDNVDVLTWGLAEGNTGVARPNATSNWTPQSCPDWQTSVGIVNGKHQDGNGDGTVDVQDLQVLINNYDSTHTAIAANSPLQFRLEEISTEQSNGQIIITYHLFAESSLGTAINTHGLSCSIDFGGLMISNATADVSNSSLAPDEHIQIFDAQRNTLNLALTRTDHNNQIIDGPVAVIIVAHEDLQAGEPFAVKIRNGRMMSAGGELNPAGGTSFYGIVGVSGAANEPLLSVFATDESCYTLGTANAQIIGGAAPYTYAWSNGANTAHANNLTAGTYTITITDADGYTQHLDVEINAPESSYDESGNPIDCSQYIQWASPQIHVLLEGAYRSETGDMQTDLLEKVADLPNVQPYGQAPWNYRGTEGEGWLLDNYPADAVDWVLVSFRDSENIHEVHKKTTALVLQNGELYFPDTRLLPTTSEPMYLMIQHRNHIAAMTPQPISATNNTLTYDFRTSDSYRTGTSVGQKQMPDGNWAMFAGDCDQSDTGGYDIIGQDKSIWTDSNGTFGQYLPTDLNLDGDVNGADKILWEKNNGNSSVLPK